MKIYVFTYHVASCCEFLGVTNEVFRTKEEAIAALKKWRKDELVIAQMNDWIIETDKEDYFEAYEAGRYCTDHATGFINEYEV